jgi:DNA-binding SARP family transcriptional activator
MTDSNLAERVARLEALPDDVREIKEDVKKLLAAENQREGGKKALWTIAAVAGATSSAIVSAAIKLWK